MKTTAKKLEVYGTSSGKVDSINTINRNPQSVDRKMKRTNFLSGLLLVFFLSIGIIGCNKKDFVKVDSSDDLSSEEIKGNPLTAPVAETVSVDQAEKTFNYYYTTSYNLNSGQSVNYNWNLSSGRKQHISMTPPAGADFDIYLYNPSGTRVASSTRGGDASDVISFTLNATGTWKLKVYAYSGSGTYGLSWVDMATTDNYILTNVEVDNATRTKYPDYLRKIYDQFGTISNTFKSNSLTTLFLIHTFTKVTNASWGNAPANDLKMVINEGGTVGCYRADIWTIGHNYLAGSDGVFSSNGRRALQHECAHNRAAQDLYYAGNVTEIMGTTYDTDYFEAGTRDVINWAAQKNRLTYGYPFTPGNSVSNRPLSSTVNRMYWVIKDVDTSKSLTVKLQNIPAGNDFDIYVRSKYHPSKSLYDKKGNNSGNTSESVTFTPTWGEVLVMVYLYSGNGGSYKLSATQP